MGQYNNGVRARHSAALKHSCGCIKSNSTESRVFPLRFSSLATEATVSGRSASTRSKSWKPSPEYSLNRIWGRVGRDCSWAFSTDALGSAGQDRLASSSIDSTTVTDVYSDESLYLLKSLTLCSRLWGAGTAASAGPSDGPFSPDPKGADGLLSHPDRSPQIQLTYLINSRRAAGADLIRGPASMSP